MSEVNLKEAYDKYLASMNNGSENDIQKEKYNLLWEVSNFFELVVNYVALSKAGVKYNFGKTIIPKGTKLYRIREYKEDIDFSNLDQWKAPPHKPQNRANVKCQVALYLGSTETICLLEAHIEKGKTYVLGTYEVMEDIEVGGYLSYNPYNVLHNLAGIVLNAFLIAPSRSDKNRELFSFLDSYYGVLSLDDFTNMNEIKDGEDLKLPLKFAVLNRREEYYQLTNQLCGILSEDTPEGIRFSSCYIPMESIGIECTDFNIVLYSDGISKIKYINHEIKLNMSDLNHIEILKIIVKLNSEKCE